MYCVLSISSLSLLAFFSEMRKREIHIDAKVRIFTQALCITKFLNEKNFLTRDIFIQIECTIFTKKKEDIKIKQKRVLDLYIEICIYLYMDTYT